MQKQIAAILPEIIRLRHAIHEHPELKFEEVKTAQLVTDTLKSWGYKPETGMAKTGVTAILDSGKPGKAVALRADMDALPIQEATSLPFASKRAGLMHACGHDGHVATLLLAAYLLREHQNAFQGKIKLIFQPGEEGGHGAEIMVQEGVLKNVDAIFGYHNIPTLPKNKIAVRNRCIFAGANMFVIEIVGRGGHSAAPEKAIDPIFIGSQIISALQSIISRNMSPFEPAVISVTQFHAGTADNVIPGTATLRGSIRFTNLETFAFIQKKLDKLVDEIASGLGGEAKVNYVQTTPATVNTAAETDLVADTATTLFGADNVIRLENNLMITEDFSYYLEKIPGCFFLVGTGVDKHFCHHPQFVFDDEIIPIAAQVMAQTALNYLSASHGTTPHPVSR